MNGKVLQLKTIQLMVLFVVSLIVLTITFTGLKQYESKIDANDALRIRETVEKYVVQCYATEGSYPPDIEYLSDNYGLIINDKYVYEYQAIASNIKPTVQVILRVTSDKE